MSNHVPGQLRTQYLRVQASNIRADATDVEQDWLEVADSLDEAAAEVDRLRAGRGPGTVIRDFKGDDVWRDEEGTVWVRQRQLVDAVKFNVDRLRAVIENAPHSNWCATEDSRRVYEFPPCTCWKADAL